MVTRASSASRPWQWSERFESCWLRCPGYDPCPVSVFCFRYKHWDDFANLKEGLSKYIPGKLGLADLSLYCIAACCVLLSMFDVLPSWISCTAIFALPHYISDACTLEMITLKLVMATFEWKLLAAHNVLYVASAADGCILLPHRSSAAWPFEVVSV